MTQPKPESILELVDRLDKLHKADDEQARVFGWDTYDTWPRLRDAIVAMRDFVRAIRDDPAFAESDEATEEAAEILLRLDNPKEPGE